MFLLTIAHSVQRRPGGVIWTGGPIWTVGPIFTGGSVWTRGKFFAIKVEYVFEGDMGYILGQTSFGNPHLLSIIF